MKKLKNVQNTILDSTVTADGNIHVGDKIVTNIYHSTQYQQLTEKLENLQKDFEEAGRWTEKYPGDAEFKNKLLEIDLNRSMAQQELEDFKKEVVRLAELFTTIPVNTERLRIARQHFEAGDYGAARKTLDVKEMTDELEGLLEQQEKVKEKAGKINQQLMDKANEFLILARLTALDFDRSDRFQKTVSFFELSLKANRNKENLFGFAYFLKEHNYFNRATPLYGEALQIYRQLAERNPQAFLPDVAMTAVNMSMFYQKSLPDQAKSISLAKESALAAVQVRQLPIVQKYAGAAIGVLNEWGLDGEAVFKELSARFFPEEEE